MITAETDVLEGTRCLKKITIDFLRSKRQTKSWFACIPKRKAEYCFLKAKNAKEFF